MQIKKVAVLGAGLMGHGIAQVAAEAARYEVYMRATKEKSIEKGMSLIKASLKRQVTKGTLTYAEADETLGRIHATTDLKETLTNADLIIESVPENLRLKKKVLAEADQLVKPGALIVSNTSSLSITKLASAMRRPEKFAGMHFFNPPQIMKLVEVVRGDKTSDGTVSMIVEAAKRMGKEPVLVKKDAAGFIVNRILVSALDEAVSLVAEDVASPEDIDKAIRLGLNWPMGPLTLVDYAGLDTFLCTTEALEKEHGVKYAPSPLLKEMLRKGFLGRKSGKGFYEWKK